MCVCAGGGERVRGEWLKGREVQGEGGGKPEWKVVVRIRCVGLTVCVWVGGSNSSLWLRLEKGN